MRKRLVQIFLKVVNKQITRMRAGKRLKAIKKRLADENVHNRADCKRMVIEDWKTAQNMRFGAADDEEENIQNVKFQFQFNVKGMQRDVTLPIEYETNIASFMEKIDAEPVVNFDDFVPFEALELLDFEVEKYKPMAIPQMSSYDPIFNEKPYRPGCQYESTIRQIAGEPELEKIQMAAHD